MEISANTSHSQLNTQQSAERTREDNKVDLEANQTNTEVVPEDRSTSAEPIQQASASDNIQNQNNEQAPQEAVPSAEESIGGQINVRA